MGDTMNCSTVRRLVQERAEGRLAPPDRGAFDAHVAGCPACAAELRAWTALIDGLDGLGHVEPPARVSRAVLARLRADGRIRARVSRAPTALDRFFALPARVRYPLAALAVSLVMWAPVAVVIARMRESVAPAIFALARAAAMLDRLVHETRVVRDVVESIETYGRAVRTIVGAFSTAWGDDLARLGVVGSVVLVSLLVARRARRAGVQDHVTFVA